VKVLEEWSPRTRIGKMVSEGVIKDIDELLSLGVPIKEVEIIDVLLPNLEEELVCVNTVQKQTDAGEVSSLRVVVAVGDRNGHLGVAKGKGKTFRVAIRNAIKQAKLNIVKVARGCGSWQCGCGRDHSIPYKTSGSSGSVRVTIYPAPRGTGLVANETGRILLSLAGIEDVWVFSKGNTGNRMNYAYAVYKALANLSTKPIYTRGG